MADWSLLRTLIHEEMKQLQDEGYKVGDTLYNELEGCENSQLELMKFYEKITNLPTDPTFSFIEPNNFEEIRKQRPEGPRKLKALLTDEQWQDKFLGAWIGRSAGCVLGKPLECWPFMAGSGSNPWPFKSGEGNNPGWKNIMLWFQGADAWPINNYTPGSSRAKEEYGIDVQWLAPKSMLETIKFVESDDDIRYTILGLSLLEEKGIDWNSWDIGKLWHDKLVYSQVYTAETQVYLNFAQMKNHLEAHDWDEKKEWVRTYLNPFREWIGAQIRVDGYAYGTAANPELAAELAWRDASFSHVKNGIYGAMFVAAMIAAAFVEKDNEKIIQIGLSEIPINCRLAHDVRRAVEIAKSSKEQVELVDRIWEEFKHYHPVHTNNNAALVAAALLFAGDDYEKGITTAVLGGWDTDCNGATVGSILGAKLGAKQIPEKWIAPLNDTLYSDLIGFHPISISECARRSFDVFRKLQKIN